MRRAMRTLGTVATALVCLWATGCHSAFVDATIRNQSGAPIRLVEVDYPSASFGTEDLAAGGVFRYHFKILGSGGTKLTWTDAARHDHTSDGPALTEGEMGTVGVVIGGQKAVWTTDLHR